MLCDMSILCKRISYLHIRYSQGRKTYHVITGKRRSGEIAEDFNGWHDYLNIIMGGHDPSFTAALHVIVPTLVYILSPN